MQLSKKILVIDDDPVSAKIIVQQLLSENFQVDMVSDGESAWELLCKNPNAYAMVFVDRMMFGIDGIELVHRIKKTPPLKQIPIIMITGEAEPEDHVEAIAAGVFDFLYKPIEKKLLLFLVEKAAEQGKG